MNRVRGLLPLADVVKRLLSEKKMNQLQLVELMQGKVKQSNLSAALSGKRNFTLTMLDAITEALGLEKGALYTYFVPECFDRYGNLRPKKTVDFLLQCYRLGLKAVVYRLAEELVESGRKHADVLFSLAEELNRAGMEEEALVYYHAVVEMERGYLSESDRWLISLYRLFQIFKDKRKPEAYDAAIHLHAYLRNLPVSPENNLSADSNGLKLKAYHSVVSYYLEQEMWEKAIQTCSDFIQLAREGNQSAVYEEAVVMKCEAHSQMLQYDLALQTVEEYLFEEKNGKTEWEGYFQLIRYREKTGKGEIPSISGYIAWVRRNPLYLIPSLPHLLEVCLEKSRWKELEQLLSSVEIPIEPDHVTERMIGFEKTFARIQRDLAEYYWKTAGFEEAAKRLLASLEMAVNRRAYREILACVQLYHDFPAEITQQIGGQVKALLTRAIEEPVT